MTLPVEPTERELTREELDRYSRQMILPGFGMTAQRRLANARVAVVGAGGLGSPLLVYLAAAGVGELTLIDNDTVDVSNLHRQVIHSTASVGRPKVESAAEAIARLNPHVRVEARAERLDIDNVLELLDGHDLVIDGVDNFETRYLIADACEILGLPEVWGSVLRYEGQVAVFWSGHGPALRDLFPEPPEAGSVPSCAEGGVLGVLPGQIGMAMANEAIKLITGVGEPLLGRLAILDAARGAWRELRIAPDPDRVPVSELSLEAVSCLMPIAVAGAAHDDPSLAVSALQLHEMLQARARGELDFDLVDIRQPEEYSVGHIEGSRLVPLGTISVDPAPLGTILAGPAHSVDPVPMDPGVPDQVALPRDRDIVITCRSGARSGRLLDRLVAAGYGRVKQLDGGVIAWQREVDPSMGV
ncbi:Molybdenum cofactor biosynthesis protein moeB2 [Propionibacterium freudenreichii]|nr:Molybdenum cofactor biosynthesis protein moeB2 [Propionibacterium freudenreichii]SCQ80148.1 Molybdenum cofactor biosynthesis protein moeB2 [Propionibacterium freudenreichii]